MSKKQHSPTTYKVCSMIAYIISAICLIIGVISFVVGGFLFIILAIFTFLLGRGWKKQYLTMLSQPATEVSDSKIQGPIKPIVKQENKLNVSKVETHKVTGVSFRENEILKLGLENEYYDLSCNELTELGYWDERIYQYEFNTNKVELLPEPTNPHDPKAIKVMIDDVHVGYIKAGSCSRIHNLLNDDKILKIECEIRGGKYKYIGYDDVKDSYYITKDTAPISVHLKLYIK